ncbi:MAG: hypothetical protein E7021_03955 [Alphaproteobacteria bacterium]|nr:hypothetical protein [Alphaproteobacteria bacterium]
MKKQNKKFAKFAAISGLCALGSLSADAIGLDANIYANFKDGIGADVDVDAGVAQAKVGANVGLTGVEAEVGADVLGVGANTAPRVGFDGVKARANTYAWNVANVGANAGATWKDGVYAGGTARFFEPANTQPVAEQNGQTVYVPQTPAPQGTQWVYANNGRIVGYKTLPMRQRFTTVQSQPDQTVVYANPDVRYVAQPTYRVVRRVVRPAEMSVVADASETQFSHVQHEVHPNGSTFQRSDYYEVNDPANGYRYTDKRQLKRTIIRRRVISR